MKCIPAAGPSMGEALVDYALEIDELDAAGRLWQR